jgi:PilZ domain
MSYGRGHDLSEAGMAIYVPLELQVGQEIQIQFEAQLVHVKFGVRGLVRNFHSYRYGIEFLHLSPRELQELKHLLRLVALTTSGEDPAK